MSCKGVDHVPMRTRGSPAPGESSEDPASDRATAVHAFDARTTPTGAIGFSSSGAFGMGRPSLIALSLEVEAGALRKARIVGASGALEL
jgi:hypothetical protein